MNWKDKHNVFFIGIGGIGMSALAYHMLSIGKAVYGYDRIPSLLTDQLISKGIHVVFDQSVSTIPDSCNTVENTLVIYTPAIPLEHPQLNYFKDKGFQVCKRSLVLGYLSHETFCIAVGGTHGKTTTSTLLAHLLMTNNSSFTAFLGGISENYQSNYLNNGSELMLVEADEFDRSFLTLDADMACVTSVDADHLDIYHSENDLMSSFSAFVAKVNDRNNLFHHFDLSFQGMTYGVEVAANFVSEVNKIEQGVFEFNLIHPNGMIKDLKATLPGRHNLANTTAACAMALKLGCDEGAIRKGLESFSGVQRRFSYQIKSGHVTYIDDYAHHPSEIDAIFNAVSEMYPNSIVAVVFQPHLFSRTRDFANDFASSLAKFDRVFLLPIYPAREKQIEGITSEWLLGMIDNAHKKLIQKSEIAMSFIESEASVCLTLGAGDIGLEVKSIVSHLNNYYELG